MAVYRLNSGASHVVGRHFSTMGQSEISSEIRQLGLFYKIKKNQHFTDVKSLFLEKKI